jgi:hypothetical protein
MIALIDDADDLTATLPGCPLDRAALDELDRVCPQLMLDGAPTTAVVVGQRIASFWIADEVAVYIGRTGQPVAKRVSQYYRTSIGAQRPHKGGWWIKMLRVLPELWVHWARTPNDIDAEDAMLSHFAAHLSPAARAALPAGPVTPFANLIDGNNHRKVHGIGNATTVASTRTIEPGSHTTPARVPDRGQVAPVAVDSRSSPRSGSVTTQRVTAVDRAGGRIRFPRASKHLLPDDRADVTVRIRGHQTVCRWDPRYGPPERSGVLTLGHEFAAEHLAEDEVLGVAGDGNVTAGARGFTPTTRNPASRGQHNRRHDRFQHCGRVVPRDRNDIFGAAPRAT